MKAALYTRVSTREQAKEGYSTAAQLNKLKAFCKSQDWDIVDVYADNGISAKNTDRPQLQRMISDIKNNKIDVVLVYRLDRLTRSVLDLYELLDMFDNNNCGFKSATEVYDTTTAMGRLFVTIVAALAQWERENMGERISMGLAEKAQQGMYPNGFAPFGYDLNKSESKLEINEREANTVRFIYDKYLNGYGMHKISLELNKKGIKTRLGKKWSNSSVSTILSSVYYTGAIEWRGKVINDTHDPIIDIEKWTRVQNTRKFRKKSSETSSVSSDYLFSGLIKCCGCGYNLHGNSSYNKSTGKRYYNYRCYKRQSGQCNEPSSVAEIQVEKQILSILKSADYTDIIKDTNINIENDQNIDKDALQKQLDNINDRKKKWQFAWMNELISNDDLKERLNEETQKEKEIKRIIDNYNKNDEVVYDVDEIKRLLGDVTSNWSELDRKEKKTLIQSIVEEIKYKKIGTRTVITDVVFVM